MEKLLIFLPIIFAVSKRKEYSDKPEFRGLENKTSSQLCAELGFNVAKSDKLSDRICKPYGRSTYSFYKQLKLVEENDRANAEASDKKTAETERGVNEGKCSDAPSRFKRQLPTTISPDRCTTSKAAKRSSGAKKSLAFGQEKENLANVDTHLNIESLLDKHTTQVKAIIVYPNGNVECRSSFLQESASIIINISKRNWKTVANTIFEHELYIDRVFVGYMQKVHCFHWRTRAGPRFLENELFSCLKTQNCQKGYQKFCYFITIFVLQKGMQSLTQCTFPGSAMEN